MKILILSHGGFAKGLYEACSIITGEQSFIDYICLNDKGLEFFTEKIKKYLAENSKELIYFLLDLKYGTPYNQLMIELLNYKNLNYNLITGVNLPILLALSMNEINSKKEDNISEIITDAKNSIEIQDSNNKKER